MSFREITRIFISFLLPSVIIGKIILSFTFIFVSPFDILGCDEIISDHAGQLTSADFEAGPCVKTFENVPGKLGPAVYRIFFEKFDVT